MYFSHISHTIHFTTRLEGERLGQHWGGGGLCSVLRGMDAPVVQCTVKCTVSECTRTLSESCHLNVQGHCQSHVIVLS